ncbi:MAG: NAD(P)H-dependent glycerol-3-phosphate dehydrogenase [Pseudomonadota bacterium]
MEKPDHPMQAAPFGAVAVLGAGAWGTALASVARRAGQRVRLWGRDTSVVSEINDTGESTRFLPGIPLSPGIQATTDLAAALDGAEAVLIATPSGSIRDVCEAARGQIGARVPVAICAKGIEAETGLLMAHVAADVLGERPVGALSGPTFATETALGHPTATTIAFPFSYADRLDPAQSAAVRLAVSMSTPEFRTYVSDDLVGVEVGGAVKNVIAIACGMMTGAGFAENTRAALITRGMTEMKLLAEALGGRRETVTGLAGAGDLTLTCSTQTSRNMSLGVQLGEGIPRAQCFGGRAVVVEGELNAITITDLARRLGVAMPISEAVRSILHAGADMGETFARLWARPIEAEPNAMTLWIDHPMAESAVTTFTKAKD